MLEIAIALIVGFALGCGVREWISYRRHQAAAERRRDRGVTGGEREVGVRFGAPPPGAPPRHRAGLREREIVPYPISVRGMPPNTHRRPHDERLPRRCILDGS